MYQKRDYMKPTEMRPTAPPAPFPAPESSMTGRGVRKVKMPSLTEDEALQFLYQTVLGEDEDES